MRYDRSYRRAASGTSRLADRAAWLAVGDLNLLISVPIGFCRTGSNGKAIVDERLVLSELLRSGNKAKSRIWSSGISLMASGSPTTMALMVRSPMTGCRQCSATIRRSECCRDQIWRGKLYQRRWHGCSDQTDMVRIATSRRNLDVGHDLHVPRATGVRHRIST